MLVMRRSLAIALISLLFTSAAHAQTGWEAQIREVDAKLRLAMMHGDTKLLASVIADDAKIIHGDNGGVQDKQDCSTRITISTPTTVRRYCPKLAAISP